jgi:tRNA (guanine9-N1)-methyltransferase
MMVGENSDKLEKLVPIILSKNATKKAARLERVRQSRLSQRKLKKHLAKERRKINQETSNEEIEGQVHISKKVAKYAAIERLKRALENSDQDHLRVCVDLQYEELMNEKELVHLARQLSRIYGYNRSLESPCQLTFSKLSTTQGSTFKVCCEKNDGFANYIVNRTENKVEDIFEPSSVVYLSPDAQETLEDVTKDKVYVIGGLVDDSVKKNSSLKFAQTNGIKSAKLPIVEHCDRSLNGGTFKQILTINQVFEILVLKGQGLDWPSALSKALPPRTGFIVNK